VANRKIRLIHLRRFLLIALTILVPLVSLPLAHATGITFKSFCHNNINLGTTINCTLSGVATADTIIVNIFGLGVFNAFTVTDGQSNSYTEEIFSLGGGGSSASTYIFATLSTTGSGSLTITVATGGASRIYGFAASDYTGVVGFGKTGTDQQETATNSGSSTVSLTGTSATSAMIDDFYAIAVTWTVSASNSQTTRDSGVASGPCNLGTCRAADSTSPILGWSWTGGTEACPCSVSHSALELQGAATGPVNTVFQCYGNCGNPPITLVNTNSTHAVAFNQTITLLYEFKSNLNGFLLNVTANAAKTYTNGQGVAFGVYTIASCPLGVTPFSSQCPGLLQQQGAIGLGSNLQKGRVSLANLQIAVLNGQWVGISITAQYTGLDLNDTNTGVNLFQTNEGKNPSVIVNAVPFNPASAKMGLWAWITGNSIVGTSPPIPSAACANSFGTIDCWAPAFINGACTLVTAACQTSAAILWSFILSMLFLITMAASVGADFKLPMGELFIFLFVGWILIFAGLGLTLVWIPVFFIMLLAVAFSKHTGKYF